MNRLDLQVVRQGQSESLSVSVRRVVNMGFAGRDQAAVRRHVEELAREGVAPSNEIPTLYPVATASLTTCDRIEVVEERTSGEVEAVLIAAEDRVLVGVGSDHTDRSLEAMSILKAKQICPDVLSPIVWDYEDVHRHWDQIFLRSRVRPFAGEEWIAYQEAPLASLLSAEQILDTVRSRTRESEGEGTVIFCGTVPILAPAMVFGSEFLGELIDPFLGRRLACHYEVKILDGFGRRGGGVNG